MRTPKRQNYTSLYNYLLSYHQIFDHEFGKFTHFYKKEKIVEDIVIKNIQDVLSFNGSNKYGVIDLDELNAEKNSEELDQEK